MQDDKRESLHLRLRRARQAANMRQAALAQKVGCTQSALSMFEGGNATALAQDTVRKLAETLGVELPQDFGAAAVSAAAAAAVAAPGLFPAQGAAAVVPVVFCPNFHCLSNMPYTVGGQVLFMPLGLSGRGPHCALCGELTESACPECGAKTFLRGGCCVECGAPLVAWPEGFSADPAAWAAAQRAAIETIRGIS